MIIDFLSVIIKWVIHCYLLLSFSSTALRTHCTVSYFIYKHTYRRRHRSIRSLACSVLTTPLCFINNTAHSTVLFPVVHILPVSLSCYATAFKFHLSSCAELMWGFQIIVYWPKNAKELRYLLCLCRYNHCCCCFFFISLLLISTNEFAHWLLAIMVLHEGSREFEEARHWLPLGVGGLAYPFAFATWSIWLVANEYKFIQNSAVCWLPLTMFLCHSCATREKKTVANTYGSETISKFLRKTPIKLAHISLVVL